MRGFKQKPGVDYTKEFAPVRLEIVRLVIALASRNGWALFHMDVKSTFLNGFLDQMVYVTQPPDFEIKGKKILRWLTIMVIYLCTQLSTILHNQQAHCSL